LVGFQHSIPLFKINHKYHDLEIVGNLQGHMSIITAILPIENSPMVITADDTGVIKTWDIRLCQCVQTISLGDTIKASSFVDLHIGIGIVSRRVIVVKFERIEEILYSNTNENEQDTLINFEYNSLTNEIMVCSEK
jgi:hypothetical protein